MLKVSLVFLISLLLVSNVSATELTEMKESNDVMKTCLVTHNNNYSKAAACHQEYRTIKQEIEIAELREFLKKNPQYKWPGGSAGMPHPLALEATIAQYNIAAASLGLPSYQQKMQMLMIQSLK